MVSIDCLWFLPTFSRCLSLLFIRKIWLSLSLCHSLPLLSTYIFFRLFLLSFHISLSSYFSFPCFVFFLFFRSPHFVPLLFKLFINISVDLLRFEEFLCVRVCVFVVFYFGKYRIQYVDIDLTLLTELWIQKNRFSVSSMLIYSQWRSL